MSRRRRTRSQPSVVRRAAALLLGVVATIGCMELVLSAGYRAFVWNQMRKNEASIANEDGAIRILAIGESTTAVAGDETGSMLVPRTAWPHALERILNERRPDRRFQVLNNGIMGGTSSEILELLEGTLPVLRPHIIIVMMGIKDTPDELMPYFNELPHWLRAFKTVQLVSWLIDDRRLRVNANVTDIRRPSDLPSDGGFRKSALGSYVRELAFADHRREIGFARVAIYLWYIGRLSQAEEVVQEMIGRSGVGRHLLARLVHNAGRKEEAYAILDEAAAKVPTEGLSRVVRMELLIADGRLDEAAALLDECRASWTQFRAPELVATQLDLVESELALARGDWDTATSAAERILAAPEPPTELVPVLPPQRLLAYAARGRAAIGRKDWTKAEADLLTAITEDPRKHVNMWLLAQVYRETGQIEKEEAMRRQLLQTTGRMAEYFELAKLFRLTGHADAVPEILDEAVRNIPSLKANYTTLYEIAERDGIQLIVMQYPSFSLDAMSAYAPQKDGVVFIDNEDVFAADPDRYFFEPTYPQSFSHYTAEGANLLAEHIADTVEQVVDTLAP